MWAREGRDTGTCHAKQSCDERARGEPEGGDRHAQVEAEERVAVRVQNQLNDVLGLLHIRLAPRAKEGVKTMGQLLAERTLKPEGL